LSAPQFHEEDQIYYCAAANHHLLVSGHWYREYKNPILSIALTILQLLGIIVTMHQYSGPVRPQQTWSQGFWHAIFAATLYMIGSMILMINMLGYFRGHYPQHFELDDDQRTLILQTMMFFFWLAGGAAVFQKVSGYSYADSLYFCDVTILTVGFGDFVANNTVSRGLMMPYSVIGIIFLGLMISSIRRFTLGMSKDKIIKAHQRRQRERTLGRTVTSEKELRDRLGLPPRRPSEFRRPSVPGHTTERERLSALQKYGDFTMRGRTITFHERKGVVNGGGRGGAGRTHSHKTDTDKFQPALSRDAKLQAFTPANRRISRQNSRRAKLLLLREEKDRFDCMRTIQQNTHKFKQYYALSMSVLAFGLLWCLGALVFMFAEAREQKLTYFEALYFCYVSLLTIGYGDFSPKSNAGKPFFVVWSLVAIPTMTILISDMGETVVSSINRGTFTLADWTIMPREGVWHDFLVEHPAFHAWLERKTREREEKERIRNGFPIADPDDSGTDVLGRNEDQPTLEELAHEPLSDHDLARKLAVAIKHTANDMQQEPPKRYSYEEWVEFTRLIRFSSESGQEVEEQEEEEGLVEWDWIGEDSPMLADVSEPRWVLDRLCESLNRYTRKQARRAKQEQEDRGIKNVDDDVEVVRHGSDDEIERIEEEGADDCERSGTRNTISSNSTSVDRVGDKPGNSEDIIALRKWKERIANA
jgi:potassium channel subfamily K